MSSTETSGNAPAEATATTPAPAAEFPSFGTTRGSGLSRGKRPAPTQASSSAPTGNGYKPTAIEIVTAPSEYQNPFAPADAQPAAPEAPAASATPEVAPVSPAPAPAPVSAPAPAAKADLFPLDGAPAAPAEAAAPAELNILPPEKPKAVEPETWESDGFRAPRESRPRREHRSEQPAEPVDPAAIPAQFLYVRPGVTYVPTPSNWGGAPRERRERHAATEVTESSSAPAVEQAPAAEAPAKSGGFFGWLKGLFGGESAPAAAPAESAGAKGEGHAHGRRHRGGRGRSEGSHAHAGSEGQGDRGGRRRRRGGRGRGPRGESGPSAT